MKYHRNYSIFFSVAALCQIVSCNLSAIAPKDFNRLNWVEVSHNKLSTQIMFDFAQPVFFKPSVQKARNLLRLVFPGMNGQNFDAQKVLSKLTILQQCGLVKHIAITEVPKDQTKAITMAIEFAPDQGAEVEQKNAAAKNKFLIKWSTIESPHRLIIDIFRKDNLDKLTHKDAILLHATNKTQQYDVDIIPKHLSVNQRSPRIIIDPGHGGSDTGTKGHLGLIEKDLSLDIAKRVHLMLKKRGYNALLTRHNDKEVSLLERAHLAHQLGGDFFVSIHVNSSGSMLKNSWGIETFYLDGCNLLPSHNQTGLFFVNCEDNQDTVKNLHNHMAKSFNYSKNLAGSIQNSLINTLKEKNIPYNNRGIKPEKFRLFLFQQNIPTALVEVGFLTNLHEAKRLSHRAYRNIIADGICEGIRASAHNFFE